MKVKLAISKLKIPELVQVCAEIVSKMTGNVHFPNPLPDLSDVGKAITQLSSNFQEALDGAHSLKAAMRVTEKTVRGLMVQLSAYVQTASGGDQEIILSSGMQVVKRRSPLEPLATPVNLLCLHTDRPTEAPLKWKPVAGKKWYNLESSQTPDDPVSWKPAGSCTRARFTVTGLTAGQQYWFRVCAGGPLGTSAWSDPAKRMNS